VAGYRGNLDVVLQALKDAPLLDRRSHAGQRTRQPGQPIVSVAAGAVGLVACRGSLPAAWVGRDTAGFTAGKAR
jgi:hypothetical protein